MARYCFLVIGFALFVVFGSAFSDAGEIRGTRWGMTPDEVKAVEDKEKTHLELYYTNTGGVGIIYENLEYRKQRQQLEQDKKRNAIYNLKKSDDL